MSLFDPTHVTAGVLSKFETKAKKTGTVQVLVLRFESIGEVQNLLDSMADHIPGQEHVKGYFALPVPWKNLSLSVSHAIRVTIALTEDPVVFTAILRGVKVSSAWKHGADVYTYNLQMEKELEPEIDRDLVHFVNAKGRNERTGKVVLLEWPFRLEAVEPVAESAQTGDTEEEGE